MLASMDRRARSEGVEGGDVVAPGGGWSDGPADLILAMAEVAALPSGDWSVRERDRGVDAVVVDRRFRLVPGSCGAGLELERIGAAMMAAIARRRSIDMLAAAGAGEGPPPLWLVSGSTVLEAWLRWSRAGPRLAAALRLAPGLDGAPVSGDLRLRGRRRGWQGPARLTVRRGTAGGRVVLRHDPGCAISFTPGATVSLRDVGLPATSVARAQAELDAGRRVPVRDLVSQPFLDFAGLDLRSLDEVDGGVEVGLAAGRTTLAPVPAAAMAAVPPGADPTAPWQPMAAEVAELDRLADAGRDAFDA